MIWSADLSTQDWCLVRPASAGGGPLNIMLDSSAPARVMVSCGEPGPGAGVTLFRDRREIEVVAEDGACVWAKPVNRSTRIAVTVKPVNSQPAGDPIFFVRIRTGDKEETIMPYNITIIRPQFSEEETNQLDRIAEDSKLAKDQYDAAVVNDAAAFEAAKTAADDAHAAAIAAASAARAAALTSAQQAYDVATADAQQAYQGIRTSLYEELDAIWDRFPEHYVIRDTDTNEIINILDEAPNVIDPLTGMPQLVYLAGSTSKIPYWAEKFGLDQEPNKLA